MPGSARGHHGRSRRARCQRGARTCKAPKQHAPRHGDGAASLQTLWVTHGRSPATGVWRASSNSTPWDCQTASVDPGLGSDDQLGELDAVVTERRERRVELRDHDIDLLERLVLEFFEVLHMSTVVLVPAPRASGALDLPSVDLASDRNQRPRSAPSPLTGSPVELGDLLALGTRARAYWQCVRSLGSIASSCGNRDKQAASSASGRISPAHAHA